MEEPIHNPAEPGRPVQIDYFNAMTPMHRDLRRGCHFRAMCSLAAVAVFMLIGIQLGNFDRGIMIIPIWLCGIWYVAERTAAGHEALPIRTAMTVCSMIAVAFSPFAMSSGAFKQIWWRGWKTDYISLAERVALIGVAIAVIAFFSLQISDVIRRRKTGRVERAPAAQSLRSDS